MPKTMKSEKQRKRERDRIAEAIGARVRQRRTELGWSQHRLAKELGIVQSGVSAIEQGHNSPIAATLCALADSLGVSTDWLLGRV